MCIILVIIAQAAHKDNVYDGHNYYILVMLLTIIKSFYTLLCYIFIANVNVLMLS